MRALPLLLLGACRVLIDESTLFASDTGGSANPRDTGDAPDELVDLSEVYADGDVVCEVVNVERGAVIAVNLRTGAAGHLSDLATEEAWAPNSLATDGAWWAYSVTAGGAWAQRPADGRHEDLGLSMASLAYGDGRWYVWDLAELQVLEYADADALVDDDSPRIHAFQDWSWVSFDVHDGMLYGAGVDGVTLRVFDLAQGVLARTVPIALPATWLDGFSMSERGAHVLEEGVILTFDPETGSERSRTVIADGPARSLGGLSCG